jgi:hypothetical protein
MSFEHTHHINPALSEAHGQGALHYRKERLGGAATCRAHVWDMATQVAPVGRHAGACCTHARVRYHWVSTESVIEACAHNELGPGELATICIAPRVERTCGISKTRTTLI